MMNRLPIGHNNNVAALSTLAIADAIKAVNYNVKYGPTFGVNIKEIGWADLYRNANDSLHSAPVQALISDILDCYIVEPAEKRMYSVILDDAYLTAWKSAALAACAMMTVGELLSASFHQKTPGPFLP